MSFSLWVSIIYEQNIVSAGGENEFKVPSNMVELNHQPSYNVVIWTVREN